MDKLKLENEYEYRGYSGGNTYFLLLALLATPVMLILCLFQSMREGK